jgi:hypothetical protein
MVTPAAPLVKTGSMQLGARLPGCVVERHGRVPVGGQREEGEVEHLLEPCRRTPTGPPALHKFTVHGLAHELISKQRTNDLPGRCARDSCDGRDNEGIESPASCGPRSLVFSPPAIHPLTHARTRSLAPWRLLSFSLTHSPAPTGRLII